jgi:hypothetical protein
VPGAALHPFIGIGVFRKMAEIVAWGRASVIAAIASSLAAAGCAAGLPICATSKAQYVLVERRLSQETGLAPVAEITPTPAYQALRANFKTVALRLPDNCYLAELHKGENQDNAQLESSCGIPLQVLERALTEEGFQVLSWSTLMGIEHQQNVPVHVAAQQIGADIVIIVNDMYVGNAPSGASAEATYRYFISNELGEQQQPAEIFKADRTWLKEFVRDRGGNDPQAQRGQTLQARLNATVVLAKGQEPAPAPVPTTPGHPPAAPTAAQAAAAAAVAAAPPPAGRSGEAIWFYNWRLGQVAPDQQGRQFLFAGIPTSSYSEAFPDKPAIDTSDPNRHYWWPLAPRSAQAMPAPQRDQATSEESFKSSAGVSPEVEATLYRKIAKDFIMRFKGG